ncbi:minor capsid protein [Gordonia phage LilyPad]|nr:minor capsid protein [Gordonia phage LilyPad]
MAKVRIKYNDRRLRRNVQNLDDVYDDMIKKIVEYHAAQGEIDMKTNAPWTDRTTAARNGLHTIVQHKDKGHYTIIFSHSVHYGIWLEVKFSGRDAIIMPTVLSRGRALMKDLRKIA